MSATTVLQRAASPAKPAVRWSLAHALPKLAMRRASREGDFQGRLVIDGASCSPEELNALIKEIRDAGVVHGGRFAYITARLPVVKEVLTHPDFRTGLGLPSKSGLGRVQLWAESTVLGPLNPPSLLVTEPPDHTRYRKLVTRVFSVRAVEELRVRAEKVAHELLDDIDASNPTDLVETYCAQLPVTLIAQILGVPTVERDRVLDFGSAAAPSLDVGLSWRQFRSVERALGDFDHWLGDHLARLRRNPGDDLMSKLVLAEEDGVGLDERELKATAGLVLAAGFETTVNLLSNGTALLHDHPEQLTRLREDPSLWPNAVDEVLRYDPPVLLTGRTALKDTVVQGVKVPRGSILTTVLAGANRDPDVFTDPDLFDVGRDNAREHVSFSAGRHYCLGAALARMEGEVGLRVLFERYPDLRRLPGSTRRPTRILRGFEQLPVQLAP